MNNINLYINGIGCISPVGEFDEISIDQEFNFDSDFLYVKEPDYKKYLNPSALRRMSKLMKMGASSTMMSLSDAGIEKPTAIIGSTGLGCLHDTSKFLANMVSNNEEQLNPTPFIQSTHNTVTGLIANITKCNGYNVTYAHRSLSFETALLDAFMLSNEEQIDNILVSAFDELSDDYKNIIGRFGLLRNRNLSNNINESHRRFGEGSVSFLLSKNQSDNSYSQISTIGMKTCFSENFDIDNWIIQLLEDNKQNIEDVDLIIFGGNYFDKNSQSSFKSKQFSAIPKLDYKILCGEYFTSSAFALALASVILKRQTVPNQMFNQKIFRNINNILVYNNCLNNHSLIGIKKC